MVSGILEVQLLDAKGLKNTDLFRTGTAASKMDPYVILKYRSEERRSRVAKKQGRNPSWNETFKFRTEFPSQNNQYKLVLTIMDKDTFTRDDFVGEATVYLGDVIHAGAESGFSELQFHKSNVVLSDKTYCGEIRISVTFTRKEEHSLEEELGGWKHSAHF